MLRGLLRKMGLTAPAPAADQPFDHARVEANVLMHWDDAMLAQERNRYLETLATPSPDDASLRTNLRIIENMIARREAERTGAPVPPLLFLRN